MHETKFESFLARVRSKVCGIKISGPGFEENVIDLQFKKIKKNCILALILNIYLFLMKMIILNILSTINIHTAN